MFDIERAVREMQEVAQMKPVPFGTGGKVFDPEKVDALTAATICSSYGDRAMFVKASDYDQLLELYRKERQSAESYANALQYGE